MSHRHALESSPLFDVVDFVDQIYHQCVVAERDSLLRSGKQISVSAWTSRRGGLDVGIDVFRSREMSFICVRTWENDLLTYVTLYK